jgi:hypothetical protein
MIYSWLLRLLWNQTEQERFLLFRVDLHLSNVSSSETVIVLLTIGLKVKFVVGKLTYCHQNVESRNCRKGRRNC